MFKAKPFCQHDLTTLDHFCVRKYGVFTPLVAPGLAGETDMTEGVSPNTICRNHLFAKCYRDSVRQKY